jgi:hypothetical protein
MQIRVAVERLVLEGLDVPRHHHALLQATVEAELGRLVTEGGLGGLAGGTELPGQAQVPRLAGGTIAVAGGDPVVLGREIARATYAALGPGTPAAPAGRE